MDTVASPSAPTSVDGGAPASPQPPAPAATAAPASPAPAPPPPPATPAPAPTAPTSPATPASPATPDMMARVRAADPEAAAQVDKTMGDLRRAIGERRTEAPATPAPAPAPNPLLDNPFLRRLTGLDDGNALEGIEIPKPPKPDFAAMVGTPPDDVLVNPSALGKFMADVLGKAHDAGFEAGAKHNADMLLEVNRRAAAPMVEQHRSAAQKAAEEATVATIRSLPGMSDDAAYDAALEAFDAEWPQERLAASGLSGIDAFRQVWAIQAAKPENAGWFTARPASPATPAAAPEVVTVRPVRPPPTPAEVARASSASFLSPDAAPIRSFKAVPGNATGIERARAIAEIPEMADAVAGRSSEPGWMTVQRLKAAGRIPNGQP